MLENFASKHKDKLYFIFRVFVGLLFMQHGAQKLFGYFGATQVDTIFGLYGAAGIIEFFGGLAIALGLMTRLVASIGAIEMVVAYFKAHYPKGWVPILNGGELALLYFAAFLALIVFGGGRWSFDEEIRHKKHH